MIQQIVSAVVPVVVAGAVAVAVAIAKAVGDAAVAFIQKKKEEVVKRIGADEYNRNLAFAKQAWGMVDEYFRITPAVEKTLDSTLSKFKEFLLAKVPWLTDAEIRDLQQTVAGIANAWKSSGNVSACGTAPAEKGPTDQEVVASAPTGAE